MSLNKNASLYQQMFEVSPAVKLITDPSTMEIIDANQAACDFYGYTREQLTVMRITEIAVVPEDQIRSNTQQYLAQKRTSITGQHRLASGELRDVEVFLGLIEVDGKSYMFSDIQDITERKQAEKALHESEKLRRFSIQNMPSVGVFMFDAEMRYTLAEGPFIKRFGLLSENIVGKTPQETFLSEESKQFIINIYQRVLQGESLSYERVVDDVAYQAFVTPLREDTGKIIGGISLNQDITERNDAEKAFRQSQALYSLVTQHMPNTSVIMFDTNMRYTLAEGNFLRRFGLSTENMLGKTPQEILQESASKFLIPIYQRVLNGEAFTFERITEQYAYEAYVSPVLDENQHVIGGITLNNDITERLSAEKARRESEMLYHSFIQNMPNTGVLMFDTNMRYTFAEGAFFKRHGPSIIVGKTPEELLTPELLDFFVPLYKRALQGESFTIERVTDEFAYEAYYTPIKNGEGRIIGGMTLNHDITERAHAEKALRLSEQRFHSLVDLAPVGIIQTDADGKRIFCNSQWCQMTGLTLEQALSTDTVETIYPDDREIAGAAWDDMMRTHLPFDNCIFRYQRRDTSTVWVSGNGRPLYDENGEVTGYIGSVTDITESRSNQEQLRQERDLLRTLIDNMPDYIFLKDVEGRFVLTNVAHAEAGGFAEPSDMLGKTAFEAFQTELARQFHADDLRLIESGESLVNAERETVDALGNRVIVLTTKIPWRDAKGQIIGLIGISRDITERKLLESALITSEERFRTLIDFAPVGIVETDAHGKIIMGNMQWSELSGIPLNVAFNDNASQTVHPDDLERITLVNEEMVKNQTGVDNLEYRFVHPDGRIVWVSDSSRPLIDPAGGITGFIITMTDITQRKWLESALRQNEEQIRSITDNIQDLITQSDTKGKFLFVNPAYHSILGYAPDTLLGKSITDIIHPDDTAQMIKIFRDHASAQSRQFNIETRLRHADGHYISVETVGTLLFDSQSKYTGGVFISRDVSERKRMQNLLLEKEKLQTALDKELELNNLKTRMMNRIAHEFRTPLTVLQAAVETLTHYFERLTPEQRDSKEVTIKAQIQRLTDMLDEIGLVIRTNFTSDRIHRIPTDLSSLTRQIAGQLEQEARQPGKFELTLPETTIASVDPQVLRDALFNIMHNAVRFSDASSKVSVKLTCEDQTAILQISDMGIGISTIELPRIFEPFFRGSNINERSGLGIGLTIARSAIEAHSGTILVDSNLNQGTTVTIKIPV